jgi:murein tripeptide amidase MpaA
MLVDSDLDGGAIEVVDAADLRALELKLRPDTQAEFMQWFHFRLRAVPGKPAAIRIGNAGEATYPDAWEGYRACASYDGHRWFRVPTTFDGEALSIAHTPERALVQYAYFAPYPLERHERLLNRARRSRRARVEDLGETVEGRPMNVAVVGDEDEDRLKVWITARQHPGETMAEWFAEGALDRLLDERDPLAAALLERAVFYVVPSMNPDGGVLGNLRTNAAGANLNREWLEPSLERSPEVHRVRARMIESGVDLALDVHGDERNPYCFAAGCEGNPGYTDRLDELEDRFMESLCQLDGDFQREYGYDRDQPGEGELGCASNWIGETFDCLSLTLEMPFKDNQNNPDPVLGWSPGRARRFGRHALESAFVCLDALR